MNLDSGVESILALLPRIIYFYGAAAVAAALAAAWAWMRHRAHDAAPPMSPSSPMSTTRKVSRRMARKSH